MKVFKSSKTEEENVADKIDKIVKDGATRYVYERFVHHSFILNTKRVEEIIAERNDTYHL